MSTGHTRTFWQMPWGYPESIAVAIGIVFVGFMLQLAVGNFEFYLLASPVNYILGICVVALCAATYFFRKNAWVRWLSGVPFSVTLIMALLALSLIMGLTPQTTQQSEELFSRLGFTSMTASWPFVLVYVSTLISLGCLIVRRLAHFMWSDYAFYFIHAGLWLVLFAAGLGHADMERYVMHVVEGETEWRVYADDGSVKELPIAIQLNDFDMEEYPPKLTVIDRETGVPQPESNPDYYQIDPKSRHGKLFGWEISLEEYIHQAVRNSDSTYREVPMPGATPAVRVKAVNPSGEVRDGWVCGGNQAQLYMTLPLNEQYCVVMTVSEPKRYLSDIEVYTPDGAIKKAVIEVNKPLRMGDWTIYQYGYDNQAGRLSSYSSMELVYDPWVTPVYAGFLLVAFGAIVMLWKGKKIHSQTKRSKRNDGNMG